MDGADSEESDGEYGDLYLVSDSKNKKPIFLQVFHEGRSVAIALDTRSAVLGMSKGVYQEYLLDSLSRKRKTKYEKTLRLLSLNV